MPDARPAGDYTARFYGGALPSARTTLYTADTNVHGVIRHVGFINTDATDRTVFLWVGGIQVEMGLVVPAKDSRGVDVSMWLLRPGDLLEAQASVAGVVNCVVYGIEEVG